MKERTLEIQVNMRISRSVVIVLFALFAVVFATNLQAFNIYRVGDKIRGKEYNDASKKWLDRSFSVWVGIDEEKTELIYFMGDSSASDVATVMVINSKGVRAELETAVSKAIELSEIARKNKTDGSKSLGCFGDCSADKGNRMGLSFFAANSGKQTDLVIKMIDVNNQSIRAYMCIELSEMVKLLGVVRSINEAMEKARSTTSKQDLFE